MGIISFILDVLKLIYQVGKNRSHYPVESDGNDAWGRSTEYTKILSKIILKDGLSILIQQLQT
jgi:hypothetical protein